MKGATIVRPGQATLNQRRALVSIRKPRSCHPSRASGFVHPPSPVILTGLSVRPMLAESGTTAPEEVDQKSGRPPTDPTRPPGPPCAHLRSGRSSAVRHLWSGVESDLADLTGSQKEAAGSRSRHRLEGCTCSEAELELRSPEHAASDKSITAEKARRGSCRAGSRGAIRDPACLQRVVPEPVDPGTAAWLALMAHNSVGKLIGAPGL